MRTIISVLALGLLSIGFLRLAQNGSAVPENGPGALKDNRDEEGQLTQPAKRVYFATGPSEEQVKRYGLAGAIVDRANAAFKGGDFEKADALYVEALSAGVVNPGRVSIQRAICAEKVGRFKDALDLYRPHLLNDAMTVAQDPRILSHVGDLESEHGSKEAARKYYQRAVSCGFPEISADGERLNVPYRGLSKPEGDLELRGYAYAAAGYRDYLEGKFVSAVEKIDQCLAFGVRPDEIRLMAAKAKLAAGDRQQAFEELSSLRSSSKENVRRSAETALRG